MPRSSHLVFTFLVLVAINTILFSSLRLRAHTVEVLDQSLPLERALNLIRRDLKNAVPPSGILAGPMQSGGISGGMGIGLTFFFDFLLRTMRGYFLDRVGKNLDRKLSTRIFEHLLSIKMSASPMSAGAFARLIRTVGAAHSSVTRSSRISSNTRCGSTIGRQT